MISKSIRFFLFFNHFVLLDSIRKLALNEKDIDTTVKRFLEVFTGRSLSLKDRGLQASAAHTPVF